MKGLLSPALPFPFAVRRARLLSLAIVAVCTVSLLTGCTTGKGGESGGSAGAAAKPGEKVFRYALTSDPTNLDPAKVEDGTTIDLLQNVFEGLVVWSEKSEVVPGLAEKWDVSSDGKTYTFHLRHGVKFHNGREMTADDFKYSLDRACDPDIKSTTVQSYLNDIVGAMDCIQRKAQGVAGVKVIDPYTLEIRIDAPKSYWLGKMTYLTGAVVCKEATEPVRGGTFGQSASVGTGPFKVAEYQPGRQVTLVANEQYYRGRPVLDKISRPVILDGTTRLNKYENDELDLVLITPADLERVGSDPKLKNDVHEFARAATWYVSLNQAAKDTPFKNPLVRQAFSYAVDRDEAVRVGMKGKVPAARAVVAPGMGAYQPVEKAFGYDPAKAKQLLAQAGFPDGKNFPLLAITCRNDQPEVADTAQVIARQLKQNLGIPIQVQPMEWGEFLKQRTAKSMPISFQRWAADYLDPQDYLSTLLVTDTNGNHPENGTGYSNPQFDKLCAQADVEPDAAKRMALYQQAETLALSDAPWIPIYYQKDFELIKPRVGPLRDSLLGHLPHITTKVSP